MTLLWQHIPDGVDRSPLESLANDTSLEVLHALLMEFQKELITQRAQITTAIEEVDRAALGNSFHTTKGLAATFGLKELRSVSERLEKEISNMAAEDLPHLQHAFGAQLDQADQLVAEVLNLITRHL